MKPLTKSLSNLNKTLPLILIIIFLSIAMTPARAIDPTPLVYIDTPTKTGTTDETFTVTILAKDFSNLYTWQAGLYWNPAVLTATTLYGGPTLTDDVFDTIAPTRTTLWMPGAINNIAGKIGYSSQALTGAGGVDGALGVSYKLMKVDFKFTASGTSDLHLIDVMLVDATVKRMSINIIDPYTAIVDTTLYPIEILTNSTGTTGTKLHSHAFNTNLKQLSYNITSREKRGTITTTGFSNVTIPRNLMWVDAPAEWSVTINGAPPLTTPDVKENGTHYFVYFTYTHIDGELQIKILSKYVVPEFPAILLPALLIVLTLLAIILGKRTWSTKGRGRLIAK